MSEPPPTKSGVSKLQKKQLVVESKNNVEVNKIPEVEESSVEHYVGQKSLRRYKIQTNQIADRNDRLVGTEEDSKLGKPEPEELLVNIIPNKVSVIESKINDKINQSPEPEELLVNIIPNKRSVIKSKINVMKYESPGPEELLVNIIPDKKSVKKAKIIVNQNKKFFEKAVEMNKRVLPEHYVEESKVTKSRVKQNQKIVNLDQVSCKVKPVKDHNLVEQQPMQIKGAKLLTEVDVNKSKVETGKLRAPSVQSHGCNQKLKENREKPSPVGNSKNEMLSADEFRSLWTKLFGQKPSSKRVRNFRE